MNHTQYSRIPKDFVLNLLPVTRTLALKMFKEILRNKTPMSFKVYTQNILSYSSSISVQIFFSDL